MQYKIVRAINQLIAIKIRPGEDPKSYSFPVDRDEGDDEGEALAASYPFLRSRNCPMAQNGLAHFSPNSASRFPLSRNIVAALTHANDMMFCFLLHLALIRCGQI
jgi:hypothetical protein